MAQYTLKCGKATAKVNSTGGEFSSYIPANGREYMYQVDPQVWGSQSPVLFPIVGSIKDSQVKINGKPYSMNKHGNLRKLEFQVGKHGDDFIEMYLESDEALFKTYPFHFIIHATHTIFEDGFTTTYLVENKSGERMPMCIGGHPGFKCPIYEGEKFTDYVLKFECVEDGVNSLAPNGYVITGTEILPQLAGKDTLPLSHDLFDDRDALIFANPKSRRVKLINPSTGKGLEFSFPKFDALGVWSAPKKNADYVCLEPWCGLPAYENETGNFEDKPYVKFVNPGECFKISYSMTVIDE
ncbi:aldose 1-epimerase family protein [Youxingia wuxianensis]|uniref:Aldose 1-epimerase family protein n=1 Tax=Youxingia wuxianensis TaxID=2763678 RepID=A0A926IIA7_9FIRM|nr:aldose 1-epimerase family protein [Youxingia wuxianensis]MBC8586005.1 aldose 1-epimerase family protein [Youxingia wuxianensis]